MTDTFTRDEEDAALAAEYVLGVLDLPERAAAERRIKTDPVFAGRVTKWEFDLAGMNGGFPEVKAPNLLPQIEARLFGTAETQKAQGAAKARAAGGGWWLRFFGGSAAAGLLAVLVLATLPPPVPPTPVAPAGPVFTATLAAEGQALILAARYEGDTLVLTRTGGDAPPAGQAHELWLIAGDAAPVSLGLIDAPETRRSLPALPEGAVLAVSLEPAGGSTTGAPTGPVLVTGVVVAQDI
ncbi:MAG: anti-sigma factor [Paracoccaceae bacterium]|nr:MAG: anti-sigma factor [Paracoccaceae bacterium]